VLDEDQVKVTELPTSNSESEDVKVTCGTGAITVGCVPPLPPPPPPHEPINRLMANRVIPLKYMSRDPLRLYDKS
jgi:hypothetical protein